MNDEARGLLLVWTDIPGELESDFNEWYNREHLPDRINRVPGFTRGRRFLAVSGTPKYLALYETQSTAVMRTEPYLALNRNPDPTSRRFIPLFKNVIKGIYNIAARIGQGEGGLLAVLPASPAPGRDSEFRKWVCTDLLPGIVRSRDVVAATFAECNREVLQNAVANYTRSGDRVADSLIIVEAATEAGLADAVSRLDRQSLTQHGGTLPIMDRACTFRVLFTLHAPLKPNRPDC